MITTDRRTVEVVKMLLAEGRSQRGIAKALRMRSFYVWCIAHDRYVIKGQQWKRPVEKVRKGLFNYKQFPCWITGFGV